MGPKQSRAAQKDKQSAFIAKFLSSEEKLGLFFKRVIILTFGSFTPGMAEPYTNYQNWGKIEKVAYLA